MFCGFCYTYLYQIRNEAFQEYSFSKLNPSKMKTYFNIVFAYFFLLQFSLNGVSAQTTNTAHFHHVHLNSRHPQNTISFYETFFGATRLRLHNKLLVAFTEKSFILVDSVGIAPHSNEGTSLWHIGWAGVDGHSEYDWRKRKGIDIQMPIKGFKLPTAQDSVHWMYFYGPERELIEVSTVNENHRFEHIHLLVSDIEKSTQWFKDNLDLKPAFEKAIEFYGVLMNTFTVDNVTIVLFARPFPGSKSILVPDTAWPDGKFKSTEGSAMDHIGFSFREIEPIFERIKNNGVHIVKGLKRDPTYGFTNFFIRGPDGLLVEIVEEKPIPEGIWDAVKN
jgi:catechol 2,3-dioxygenase-like lactoylglutathione lyase family enzyme